MTDYANTTHLASASGRAYSHLPMTIVVGLFSFALIAVNGQPRVLALRADARGGRHTHINEGFL